MKTFWRKVFRWRTLLYVAAGVALLLALVVGALYTPWVRTFVLHKVEAYVRTHLNVELTAGSLRYDIFDLSASLGEVTLARPGSDLPPFFTADRISVAVPPALIFKGELRLRSFVIDRPRIDLAYGPGGTSNIPEFPKNPASPPLTRLPPLVLEPDVFISESLESMVEVLGETIHHRFEVVIGESDVA